MRGKSLSLMAISIITEPMFRELLNITKKENSLINEKILSWCLNISSVFLLFY